MSTLNPNTHLFAQLGGGGDVSSDPQCGYIGQGLLGSTIPEKQDFSSESFPW